MIAQHVPGDEGDVADLRPRHAAHRVEVDPELVRVVEVVGPDRVRVQVDAAQVDHPGELGRVADDDLAGRAARGEAELDDLYPLGP